jgi:hypothetical protein
METTLNQAIKNEELINIIPSNSLKELLNRICNETDTVLKFDYDGREEGNYSRFTIYSKYFQIDDLKELAMYCGDFKHQYVGYSKVHQMLEFEFIVDLD